MADTAHQTDTAALIRESGLRHIAIIMDGNRRWAKAKHLPTVAGHSQGVGTLKATLINAGIPTIFVNADSIGYTGCELQDDINSDPKALAMFETIRAHGAVKMGLIKHVDEAVKLAQDVIGNMARGAGLTARVRCEDHADGYTDAEKVANEKRGTSFQRMASARSVVTVVARQMPASSSETTTSTRPST